MSTAETTLIERFEIDVAPFKFRARRAGREGGRPVLFLHGHPQTSACWIAQLTAVAEAGCHGVAFDQRGYSPGTGSDDVSHFQLDNLVGDVLAVADALGFETFDLVGHDAGGGVAWATAAYHPDRVRTLTAVCTPHNAAFIEAYRKGPGSDQYERSWYMRAAKGRDESERASRARSAGGPAQLFAGMPKTSIAEYMALLQQPGAMAAIRDWYRAGTAEMAAAVPAIQVPTLYVWGDSDAALGPDAAYLTKNYVTGPYTFVEMKGVGHWIPELEAQRLNEHLLAHLAAH